MENWQISPNRQTTVHVNMTNSRDKQGQPRTWQGEGRKKMSLEKPAESNHAKAMIRCSNFILHAMGWFVRWVTRKVSFNYFITMELHWGNHTQKPKNQNKNAKKHIFSTYWQNRSSGRKSGLAVLRNWVNHLLPLNISAGLIAPM